MTHALHRRILELNAQESAHYLAAEGARKRYWAEHRTFLACVKCMDGRVMLPVMTDTPVGIVKPFRAIGGRFETFWPSFLGRVRAFVDDSMRHGSRSAILLSYHYSASNPSLGCAGWAHDTVKARAHATRLAAELGHVFGEQLLPLVIGIETDRDAITFHGPTGDVRGEDFIDAPSESVRIALDRAMEGVPAVVRADLLPLVLGNARRVQQLIKTPRDLSQLGHDERILAVGQGFDWLARENLALIVNDADPSLSVSIEVAAGILARNLTHAGPDEEVTLLAAIPYRDPGIDRRQAEVRARGLLGFARSVVAKTHPELAVRMLELCGVVWKPARRFEVIE